MVVAKERLGVGLYTPSEAAFYSRVAPQKLNRWLFGNRQGSAVATPGLPPNERLVTFLDLIQALAIRNIRLNHRVPLATIREAVQNAETEYNIKHPLAYEKSVFLYGNDLFIHLKDRPKPEQLRKLTGDNRDQTVLTQVLNYIWRTFTSTHMGSPLDMNPCSGRA